MIILILIGLMALRYVRSTLIFSLVIFGEILAATYFLFHQSAETNYLSVMGLTMLLLLLVVALMSRLKTSIDRLRWLKG